MVNQSSPEEKGKLGFNPSDIFSVEEARNHKGSFPALKWYFVDKTNENSPNTSRDFSSLPSFHHAKMSF